MQASVSPSFLSFSTHLSFSFLSWSSDTKFPLKKSIILLNLDLMVWSTISKDFHLNSRSKLVFVQKEYNLATSSQTKVYGEGSMGLARRFMSQIAKILAFWLVAWCAIYVDDPWFGSLLRMLVKRVYCYYSWQKKECHMHVTQHLLT